MCTYVTEQGPARGSGKGADGWFALSQVTAYYDHPVHAADEHTLNVDFADPARGPAARVAVELSADTAVRLVEQIASVLTRVPADLSGLDDEQLSRLGRLVRQQAG